MMSISAARLVDWGKSEEEERQRGEMAKSRLGERKTKEPDFPITKVNEATTFYYCKALPEKKGTMSGPSAPPEEQGILQEDWEKTAVASEDMINTA
ncbi:hypothetical protein MRB53_030472 [Persea americana]|uniref:Uncharacterized protein n=1 Tax=Persea americana TaxID=3435 RepID=A0ACC2KLY8_PERAE|nr:hypothetical protein MRB53_030472 [Persea americana]